MVTVSPGAMETLGAGRVVRPNAARFVRASAQILALSGETAARTGAGKGINCNTPRRASRNRAPRGQARNPSRCADALEASAQPAELNARS